MSARSAAVRLLVHAAMVAGAIFAVTVLLAAMPGHHAPAVEVISVPQQQGARSQEMPGLDHSQMDMSAEKANEKAAVSDMNDMRGGGPHMHMTGMRAQTA